VTQFPYETLLQPGERLHITKQAGAPLIYAAYATRRVTTASVTDAFEITSSLLSDTLRAGEPVTLTVAVKVKQNAEYVMIEAPIPASCSYAEKPVYRSYYSHETHREYFKEKTVIFCETLPIGAYEFTIKLLPRYTGSYILNPAKVEMMYLPVVNANNDMRRVRVE
jgi:uncharacterized protein YfaS (alpha-2-macroglobulin family)